MTATLTPSATQRSAGASSLAPTTVDVPVISDADMAWLLADVADTCLIGHERTMTFVELGCGEHHLAIDRILNAVVSTRAALPLAIFDRLIHWLDGYVGSPEEPHLRTMIADVRAQQVEPAPLRAQHALRADSRRTVAPACSSSAGRRRHA
ncbi:hypothetical protein Mycsm_03584 [Mycobacterium sp. JS623]|uniref:hypothetical protein n=1 Tax=Mycobacterium sp. JS623 TaxID=212767 RepID=UPI0002A5531E|nr:hypothetical protein [Mycobacterium sp. JS623]AGB23872.1 hypothetical protein Mycsm_03584 [Mycobacterium sp. JS623]